MNNATTITFQTLSNYSTESVQVLANGYAQWANALEAQGSTPESAIDWLHSNQSEVFTTAPRLTRGAVKRLVSVGRR